MSDVAAELGIARSTAHRLLAMLVYRDFAVQAEDRSYRPGPAIVRRAAARRAGASGCARLMRPHMEALCDQVAETINLVVRLGTQTRFLHTVESAQVLRVGDRQGTVLPAWKTSGGKALLAELPDAQLTRPAARRGRPPARGNDRGRAPLPGQRAAPGPRPGLRGEHRGVGVGRLRHRPVRAGTKPATRWPPCRSPPRRSATPPTAPACSSASCAPTVARAAGGHLLLTPAGGMNQNPCLGRE